MERRQTNGNNQTRDTSGWMENHFRHERYSAGKGEVELIAQPSSVFRNIFIILDKSPSRL